LYNYYTVSTCGVCPDGWYVPGNDQWLNLFNTISDENTAGGYLKETGLNNWFYPNSSASNNIGFTALPGGMRDYLSRFASKNFYGYWWSSNIYSQTYKFAYLYAISYIYTCIFEKYDDFYVGNSIRCVRARTAYLNTETVSSVSATTAVSGGNIKADGSSPITSRGVCWSTTPFPNITNSKTNDGSGIGSFTSTITGLTPNTLYYVRAYATNNFGTSYGQQITFTTSSK